VVLLTLTTMTLTVLAEYLLLVTEFTFAVCFLGNEIMRSALRGRITRFEQLAHSIPERRYLSEFSVPFATILAGAGAGAGAGLIASIHDGLLVQDFGLAVLIATMIPFTRFQLGVAAGAAPRPVSRARLRRLLSDADRRLAAQTELSPDEVTMMRTMLMRTMRVGDRLTRQPFSWHDAIRRERRLLTMAVAQAILFALVVGSLAVVRLTRGDLTGFLALGFALLLVAADLTGVFLRRNRCRCEQYDLGVELRSASTRLLARLETIPANPPTASAGRIVSMIRTCTRQWLRMDRTTRRSRSVRRAAGQAGDVLSATRAVVPSSATVISAAG
jgi:hypothetical protein